MLSKRIDSIPELRTASNGRAAPLGTTALAMLLAAGLSACGTERVDVQPASGLASPTPSPTFVATATPLPGEVGPTTPALRQKAIEESQERYKRFKYLENEDPEMYTVCKFDDGRLAGMIIRHLGRPPEGTDATRKESIEEKTKNRKEFCQKRYGGTWEEENPK